MPEILEKQSLLSRVSRVVGLDVQYFFGAGAVVSSRYIIISLLGLVLSVGFARLGSKELLGQYQTILAFLGVVSIFSLPGLNMAALKSVVEGNVAAVLQAVRLSFLGALFGVPVLLLYAGYNFFLTRDLTFAGAVIFASILFPFFYAFNTWYVFYEGRSQFFPVAWRTVLLNTLVTVVLLGALYWHANVITLLLFFLGINVILSGRFLFEVSRTVKKSFPQATSGKLDVRYGFSVSLQKFIFSLAENLPVILISFFFGFEEVAVFQIAFFFVNAVAGFLSGISATYMPLLFRYKELAHGKVLLQHVAFGLVLFVAFRFFVEQFFLVFYSASYQESLEIVRNLSFLVLLLPLKTFLLNFFTVKKQNLLVVLVFLSANLLAVAALYCAKGVSMGTSATAYLYTLNGFLSTSLLGAYLYQVYSKKRLA